VALEAALTNRSDEIRRRELEQSLGQSSLDVTLPGRPIRRGRLHPSTQQLRRVLSILAEMGFQVYTSPKSKPVSSTSNCSISRCTIRHAKCRTRCTLSP